MVKGGQLKMLSRSGLNLTVLLQVISKDYQYIHQRLVTGLGLECFG